MQVGDCGAVGERKKTTIVPFRTPIMDDGPLLHMTRTDVIS